MKYVIKTILLFLIGICTAGSSFGQTSGSKHSINVFGTITELHTMTPVPNAEILILKNLDTLLKTSVNQKGEYSINLDVAEGDHLEFQSSARHHVTSNNLIIVAAPKVEQYHLNIELIYQTVSHYPPDILFELNESDPIPFDNQLYKELLEDNPKICIEISHYGHPDESEKLTKKRLLRFEKYMIENGFKMNQLDLNFTHHVARCDFQTHCHAQIYFEITSMDGHCLQE